MPAQPPIPDVLVERIQLVGMAPAPYNPHAIGDLALAGLEASMGRFGAVEPRNAGGPDTLANLQTLCHECHSQKTGAEGTGR